MVMMVHTIHFGMCIEMLSFAPCLPFFLIIKFSHNPAVQVLENQRFHFWLRKGKKGGSPFLGPCFLFAPKIFNRQHQSVVPMASHWRSSEKTKLYLLLYKGQNEYCA
jgi:hypothetical protein